ncbi:MAG: AmmeMemoRadiSam system protein B [Planctomycetota bacterium]
MDGAELDDPAGRPRLRSLRAERVTSDGRPGLALSCPLELCEPVFVPRALLPVLTRMDGDHTAAEIAALATRDLRRPIDAGAVAAIAADLDRRLLLASPRFVAARDRAVAAFLGQPTRPSRHHGSAGYPAGPTPLRAALRAMVPDPSPDAAAAPRGLIAPHIDYGRGGPGYAAAYGRLLQAPPADLYVVFGTGHQGPADAVTGLALDWATPLGTATTDRAFLARVHDRLGAPSPDDLLQHRAEHSLELQVVLLQHLAERRGLPPPRIAGFLCGALPSTAGDPTAEPWFGRTLAAFRDAAAASGGTVCWLAGADLAHVGPMFGDPEPVGGAALQQLGLRDRSRLRHLEVGRPGAFHRETEGCGNADRVCSAAAITLVAALAGGSATLLHYGQAAADDGHQAVTYCAASFG